MLTYMNTAVSNGGTLEDDKRAAKVRDRYNKLMVHTYIRGFDQRRCGKLPEDMSNDYTLG